MTKIIAVANLKGGVGKTTTVINLAASLAIAEKKVLIVDTDPGGDSSRGLGFHSGKVRSGFYNVLVENQPIRDAIRQTPLENLFILPSHAGNFQDSKKLLKAAKDIYQVKSLLASLSHNPSLAFDYILIDTPPSVNDIIIGDLTAAHSVLIPVQCGMYAIESMMRLMDVVQVINGYTNPELELEGILITFFERNTKLSRKVIDDFPAEYRKYLFKTIITKNSAIGYAAFLKRPVALVDISAPGAQAYMELASEILRKNQIAKKQAGNFAELILEAK